MKKLNKTRKTILLLLLSTSLFANNNKEKKIKDDDLSTKDCAVVASYTMSIIEENFGCIDDTECYNEIWQITYDHCRDSMFN